MAKTVKLINPGPASLLIVNPTGGTSKMRKRKSSSRVKRTRRHNPYSASAAPKRRRSVMRIGARGVATRAAASACSRRVLPSRAAAL